MVTGRGRSDPRLPVVPFAETWVAKGLAGGLELKEGHVGGVKGGDA